MYNQPSREKYLMELQENMLPFWEKAIDRKFGGVFTCYTNEGDRLISDRKYVWSQGRFLWLACKLQMLKEQGMVQLSQHWKETIDATFQFLNKNAVMSNNHIVFALERDGRKIDDEMDKSIFADCFYVLGCNAYSHYMKDMEAFEHSLIVYKTVKLRIENNDFDSEPYPIPAGYKAHSIPMILLNVVEELYETANAFHHPSRSFLLQDTKAYLDEIMKELAEDGRIVEMKPAAWNNTDTLLSRHVNPGHTLESSWFMIHSLRNLQLANEKDYISDISKLAMNALTIGWDERQGGLFRFVDKEGGMPQGELIGTPIESLIRETWDTKLWWPHSEALYTTLLFYEKTGEKDWLKWHKKLDEYVFHTFPNKNKEIGEWIQIRDRNGAPLQKVVALPVKDPFHIIRNYILIIQLLEGKNYYDIG
ncbi:AGE family epimerase/isomerase [Bacillus sp. FJAT-50079]|uniref:AGE family epimerase/isomerase n=1 Tax=Bacillus sp. FJAT-50079 TaxID=2833577 RepID=UPI001BCA38F5|nr:AGE family epimerase/isomerase [Bacillus sp. FJAT-50079]MBS4208090.1 AGE family epimerase/isomerase [Bacillus sp. FJAT-50079]